MPVVEAEVEAVPQISEVPIKIDVEKPVKQVKKTGNLWTVFNMMTMTVGASMLSVPIAFKWSGYFIQSTIAILLIFATHFTLDRLVIIANAHQVNSYSLVCSHIGSSAKFWADFLILCACGGYLIGYIVYIGDFAMIILSYCGVDMDIRLVKLIFAVLILFPLCLRRYIEQLKYVSMFAMILVLSFVVILTQTLYSSRADIPHKGVSFSNADLNMFGAISMCVSLLAGHTSAIPIHKEMADPSPSNFSRLTAVSLFLTAVIYLSIGLFGYLLFGSEVESNLLENFPATLKWTIVTFCFMLVNVCSFAIFNFALRVSLHNLLFGTENESTTRQHFFETLGVFLCVLVIGIFVSDISVVLRFSGAICYSFIGYILPCRAFLKSDKVQKTTVSIVLCHIIEIFGAISGIMGFVSTILDLI